MSPKIIVLSFVFLMTLAACEDPVATPITCGEGTELNAAGDSCIIDSCTISEASLTKSFEEGVASVDITTDNVTVADEAFAAGVASVDITSSCAADDAIICADGGGAWDTNTETCAKPPAWLMVQDAADVSFTFDPTLDVNCPAGAFWSGTLTMSEVDDETLWFTDRPYRLAYVQSTEDYSTDFPTLFNDTNGGAPNAVLNWFDSTTNTELHTVIEIDAPVYDSASPSVVYGRVCGLMMDDANTLEPLPMTDQVQPPANPTAVGNFTLFIDNATVGCNLQEFLDCLEHGGDCCCSDY